MIRNKELNKLIKADRIRIVTVFLIELQLTNDEENCIVFNFAIGDPINVYVVHAHGINVLKLDNIIKTYNLIYYFFYINLICLTRRSVTLLKSTHFLIGSSISTINIIF